MSGRLTPELLARAPKALLHDHLDGGVRPATVIELAQEFGYDGLPTTDVDDLAHWFNRGAKRNDLVLYLETFAHTVGVMQHKDAIERVAFECAQDLAADGVVLRRGAHGAGAVHRGRADARRGDAGDPRRVRQGLGGHRPDDLRHRHGDAHGGPQPGDRRAGRALARRRRRRVRHRRRRGRLPAHPAPRRVPVRHAGQLPHHDPRRRGVRRCRASGRPCSGAGPSASATACASSTTSPGRPATRSSAGWRRSCATPGSRSSCARRRTSTPASSAPSPSTRSRCCGGCASGSR